MRTWLVSVLLFAACSANQTNGEGSSPTSTVATTTSDAASSFPAVTVQTGWVTTLVAGQGDSVIVTYQGGGFWSLYLTTGTNARVFNILIGMSDVDAIATDIPQLSGAAAVGQSAGGWWYAQKNATTSDADSSTGDADTISNNVDAADAGQANDVSSVADSDAQAVVTDSATTDTYNIAMTTRVEVNIDEAPGSLTTFSFHVTAGHSITLDAEIDGYDEPFFVLYHDPTVAYDGDIFSDPSSLPAVFTPQTP
jgi:hypothetical protein